MYSDEKNEEITFRYEKFKKVCMDLSRKIGVFKFFEKNLKFFSKNP